MGLGLIVNLRLNKKPPNIEFRPKGKGGISISRMVECELEDDLIKSILHEYRIMNADIVLRCNASADDLIDIVEGNRKFLLKISDIYLAYMP